ncbi:MAG: histidine kinase, partial [Chloroflexota bacterium]
SLSIGDLPTIEADPIQMRQLMQNLLGNALKFCQQGKPPQIKVWADPPEDGYVSIHVQDSGIGFEEEHMHQLFKPFKRLRGRSEYEGSGMGLAISRKITERHGGQISAESHLGVGSIFTVKLPIKQST